jgi:TolB-like protein
MAWLKVDPTLDSLREDPHFGDLLLRLGLADKAASPEQGIQSVAVLPLENIGGDPKTEFLSDGLADQIINSLLQVRRQNLKVRPFTSVARYKLQKPDLRTIARDLDVQAIVTGSLRQQGDDLSIGIELVDAREDNVLWTKRYPGKLSDILDLQDQIARDVAANLRLRLTGEEEQRLTKHYTTNSRAYLLYQEGVFHLNKFTPEGLQIGIEYFQRALKMDPNYASALVGVGRCKVLLGTQHLGPKATHSEARELLTKALMIDSTVADAHAGLGAIHLFHDWDWPAAERELKQAIGTEVSAPFIWNIYGFYLASQGRLPEALESIQRGQQIDPLAAPRRHEVAMCYVWMRQYDQAIAESKKALELDPNFLNAYAELSKALAEKGMYDEAIAELRKAPNFLQGTPLFLGQLGYAHAMAGKRVEAEKFVEELRDPARFRYGCAIGIASIQAALGEKEQAFEWLDKACAERHSRVIWVKVDPIWDNLRSDQRFAQLLKDMRLPP